MKLSAITVLCLLAFSAKSQNDSLRHVLNSAIQEKKSAALVANLQGRIGWTFLRDRQYDSAIFYLKKSLQTTRADSSLLASNLNSLGIVFNNLGLPDSATNYYEEALAVYDARKDTLNKLTIANNLAIIFKNRGLYEKALETAFAGIERLENIPPNRTLASSYNTIAGVYAQMDDQPNALVYFQKALAIRKAIGYERGVGQSYNNIGETFINMSMYDSALSNLTRALEIKRRMNDANAIGTTLNFIGLVYLRTGKYDSAEPPLLESLSIKRSAGEQLDEGMVLNNLAALKLATHQSDDAERHLDKAIELFKTTRALPYLQEALELRVRLYKSKGKPPLALKAMEELLIVKDSLLNKEKVESLLAMQIKYETEEKAQQIQLLEQEDVLQEAKLSEHRHWILGLIAVVALLVVTVIFIYVTFRLTRRNKHHVETLLKELHHRVKNNLQLLASIFSLQGKSLTDEKTIQAVRTSEARVNAMALIHRKLYNVDRNRTLSIREYISELLQYLIHAYGYQEHTLSIGIEVSDMQVDVDKAIPMGLILNELISNALKYAYETQPNPALNINVRLQHNHMHIDLSDNGIGLPATAVEQPDSFGLRMVNMLIRQLKGSIDTSVNNGTHYSLKIPIQ
ncbi:MAG TPA: tetratricopeptide repeat protein [Chryseolinea sp.]|nr:tetratricopeptide repeat protein [Chryseolinea sp.]